jgi:putative ABC transport system permease protein
VALGADRGSVLRLVLREGALVAALGLAVGLSGAAAAAGLMRNAFFGGRGASDPLLFVGVGAVLLVVTFLASALPARRATRIDPLAALRAE